MIGATDVLLVYENPAVSELAQSDMVFFKHCICIPPQKTNNKLTYSMIWKLNPSCNLILMVTQIKLS